MARRLGRVFAPFVAAALLATAAQGCAPFLATGRPPSPAESTFARTRFNDVMSTFWRHEATRRHDLALVSGLRLNLLPDLSQEARKREFRLAQDVIQALDAINVSALSQDDYLTTLALRWDMEVRVEAAAFFLGDFSFFAPVTSPMQELAAIYRLHPLGSTEDLERYLYFVQAVPFVLERVHAGLEERRERGYVASRAMVESSIRFFDRLRALGTAGPWQVAPSRLATLDSIERRAFESEVTQIATRAIVPALESMLDYLQESYLPSAPERSGLWQYPGGKELYRHLLRRHTSLDITPEEAHQVGLGELRRIDAALAGVRRQRGWNADSRALHDSLRRALGAATSVDAVASALVARQAALGTPMGERFRLWPALPPAVRSASQAESALWPSGTWIPATSSDSAGTLLLTQRWRDPALSFPLASHSYRWLLPGRYMQATLVGADPGIPAYRRLVSTPSFDEGWAHYAASLAGEMGLYADPLDAYGRLLEEGLAAAFLVVDTGIHYLGWTATQARLMLGRYSLANDAVLDTMVVERVVNEPGRAGAAMLGAREVAALRAWIQQEQGAAFSLPDWHAELLSLGSLPLPIVGSHMEWWLYDTSRRAAEAAARADTLARGGKGRAAKGRSPP